MVALYSLLTVESFVQVYFLTQSGLSVLTVANNHVLVESRRRNLHKGPTTEKILHMSERA
jgi:hypothetical protein